MPRTVRWSAGGSCLKAVYTDSSWLSSVAAGAFVSGQMRAGASCEGGRSAPCAFLRNGRYHCNSMGWFEFAYLDHDFAGSVILGGDESLAELGVVYQLGHTAQRVKPGVFWIVED